MYSSNTKIALNVNLLVHSRNITLQTHLSPCKTSSLTTYPIHSLYIENCKYHVHKLAKHIVKKETFGLMGTDQSRE